ncbi:UNVERIFIED_CONTAM: hypothetical protein Sradi_1589600 [Sesamum radiatum]|uniref:Uncharacterized protein n=1 Tax=Sesamum radiatum TaxID=300843 RepID=A0AAW2UAF1_SESRA
MAQIFIYFNRQQREGSEGKGREGKKEGRRRWRERKGEAMEGKGRAAGRHVGKATVRGKRRGRGRRWWQRGGMTGVDWRGRDGVAR